MCPRSRPRSCWGTLTLPQLRIHHFLLPHPLHESQVLIPPPPPFPILNWSQASVQSLHLKMLLKSDLSAFGSLNTLHLSFNIELGYSYSTSSFLLKSPDDTAFICFFKSSFIGQEYRLLIDSLHTKMILLQKFLFSAKRCLYMFTFSTFSTYIETKQVLFVSPLCS